MCQGQSEEAPAYNDGDKAIRQAINLLEARLLRTSFEEMTTPDAVRKYLFLQLAEEESEQFCCMFLDNRHRMLAFKVLFNGTIDGASVHPREVVKEALKHNAAAVVLAHNHPSGEAEPSRADQSLTKRLVDALALVDVRILDHIVVGRSLDECVSFAERGLI